MNAARLARERTTLVVVDIQEAFREVVHNFEEVVNNAAILVEAAGILGVPVVATEQYPRGLGQTVPELAVHLVGVPRIEKVVFSAARAEGFSLGGRDQAVVCGIEAHVCVSQTVQDLIEQGCEVHVVADAVSSRTPENRQLGLEKMAATGALPSSTEIALFELLGRAGTNEFKAVQELVR